MQFKDYYQILDVDAGASSAEIKSAYRKLARKYHPDVSKEPEAEERFKAVGEAYEVLKDNNKRAEYDNLRKGGFTPGEDFTPPPGFGGFSHEDLGGMHDLGDLFSSLFQGGGGFRQSPFNRAQARGQDIQYKLRLTLQEAASGIEKTLSLNGQSVKVKIPAGVTDAQKIRLKGRGQAGSGGGPQGDCYLLIELEKHPDFRLEGKHVYYTLPLTPWEAALGASLQIPTLKGPLKLKIPANSCSGTKLRLAGRGLDGGDQFVTLQIHTPPALNDNEKQFYNQMAKQFTFNPRK